MFWKKKQVKEKQVRNKLKIIFKRGTSRDWWIDDYKGSKKITPWINFHKWFFSRKSEFFTIRTNEFDTTIKRSEILEFQIILEEVDK